MAEDRRIEIRKRAIQLFVAANNAEISDARDAKNKSKAFLVEFSKSVEELAECNREAYASKNGINYNALTSDQEKDAQKFLDDTVSNYEKLNKIKNVPNYDALSNDDIASTTGLSADEVKFCIEHKTIIENNYTSLADSKVDAAGNKTNSIIKIGTDGKPEKGSDGKVIFNDGKTLGDVYKTKNYNEIYLHTSSEVMKQANVIFQQQQIDRAVKFVSGYRAVYSSASGALAAMQELIKLYKQVTSNMIDSSAITTSVETPEEGTLPVGTPPVGTPPVGTPPVGTPPVGTPPVGTLPVGTLPVGTPPVGTLPVGTPREH